MILCLVTVFGILIFIEYYTNQDIYKKDTTEEAGSNFITYIRKYFIYLFYFIVISLFGYGVFKLIEKGFLFTFKISFWLTMGLLVLVLALFSKSTEKMKFDSPTLDLIKNIIMYIPCLVTDAIEFAKKDYENTPSTVFIVFLMILVYVSIFYLYPLFREVQYQNDGILLIDSPRYLKDNVLSMTSNELKEKILDKRPFYDRWFHHWATQREMTKNQSQSVQIEEKKGDTIQLMVPPDSITYSYYVKEGFASIVSQEANLIPFEEFERRVSKMYGSLFDFADEDIARERMKQFIIDHPELLTVLEKIQYLYSVAFASWDTLMYSPQLLFTGDKVIEDNIYHYSLSSWVYLQQVESREKQLIYSFGSRPSLYYDPVLSTLCVYTNYNNNQKRRLIYSSDKILFQRWIFVVMNYNYGTLDLFINNNLVGTYTNVIDNIDPSDLLIVGSDENKNIGGICNMKYYELPIGSRKINSIYTTFHNKKIPI